MIGRTIDEKIFGNNSMYERKQGNVVVKKGTERFYLQGKKNGKIGKRCMRLRKVGVCKVMKDKAMESELHDMDER
jgi:hypothetical protein